MNALDIILNIFFWSFLVWAMFGIVFNALALRELKKATRLLNQDIDALQAVTTLDEYFALQPTLREHDVLVAEHKAKAGRYTRAAVAPWTFWTEKPVEETEKEEVNA